MPNKKLPIETTKAYSDRALLSGAAGVFAFATITIVVSRLGVSPLESVLFSILSGVCVAIFVYRERRLTDDIEQIEQAHLAETSELNAQLEFFFKESLACCVEFDAGTFIVSRASPGFFEMLRLDSQDSVEGARLEDLLGLEATKLEKIVVRIRKGDLAAHEEFSYQRPNDEMTVYHYSGFYVEAQHRIVLTLFNVAKNKGRRLTYYSDSNPGLDVESLRRSMATREARILELKGEVNQVLRDNRLAPRYKVDHVSDDSNFEIEVKVKQEAANDG